jgi:REP element-mobilizing transposase RayT
MSHCFPQAYHITWGTYGTRLHGCERPFVDEYHNEHGTPFPPTDPEREFEAREAMVDDAVILTVEQRRVVDQALTELAARFEWTIHALAPKKDHTHIVITALRDGDELREALKAGASRALNALYGKRRWWAEGGSDRYLWERSYFLNAIDYVNRQREF